MWGGGGVVMEKANGGASALLGCSKSWVGRTLICFVNGLHVRGEGLVGLSCDFADEISTAIRTAIVDN